RRVCGQYSVSAGTSLGPARFTPNWRVAVVGRNARKAIQVPPDSYPLPCGAFVPIWPPMKGLRGTDRWNDRAPRGDRSPPVWKGFSCRERGFQNQRLLSNQLRRRKTDFRAPRIVVETLLRLSGRTRHLVTDTRIGGLE